MMNKKTQNVLVILSGVALVVAALIGVSEFGLTAKASVYTGMAAWTIAVGAYATWEADRLKEVTETRFWLETVRVLVFGWAVATAIMIAVDMACGPLGMLGLAAAPLAGFIFHLDALHIADRYRRIHG